ncbi:hypothetical protein Taro_034793 [Colocasia esculenta]|uniref:Uncharacterized protein n=1 Tax=Colocasia esculenta TaxID=4460 RepID=A0A843W8M2_COLES|nr:hypothetical protein [Colocasia esculenta]
MLGTPAETTEQPKRVNSDNQNNTKQLWGEPPPKAPRAVLGEPRQYAAQPNGTLQTTEATQRWPKTNRESSWEEPPLEVTKGDPGKKLHQNAQPNDQTTQTVRENTAASRTVEATQADSGRTSTRTTKALFWENLLERTKQTNSTPQTLRHGHLRPLQGRGPTSRTTLDPGQTARSGSYTCWCHHGLASKTGPRNRENTEAETTRSTGLHKARPTTPTETRHSKAITAVQARAMDNTWKCHEEMPS